MTEVASYPFQGIVEGVAGFGDDEYFTARITKKPGSEECTAVRAVKIPNDLAKIYNVTSGKKISGKFQMIPVGSSGHLFENTVTEIDGPRPKL